MSNLNDLPLFAKAKAIEPEKSTAITPAPVPAPVVPTHEKPKALTVSELTSRIRGIVEPEFTQVWVQGEISNYRPTSSGHAYFSLKDADAMIGAAIFGWGARNKRNPKTAFEIKDGLQVLVRGKLTVYPPRGGYQLVIDAIEPLGAGALQIAFEQLKTKLAAEGLFNPATKKKLPRFPKKLAIVTSPSGAAIRDMLNILARRAPHIQVTVVPALVQGDAAASQILRGLKIAERHHLGDIIILARGGGSIEDMWCFNDEELARAIAQCSLPVVSAVGHEIDFTISDFASDLRAPTPSAAAELVTGHWVDSIRVIREAKGRMVASMGRELQSRRRFLEQLAARVVSPRDRLREQMQRCDDLMLRLDRGLKMRMDRLKGELARLSGKMDALSPLKVLQRGYTIVKDIQTNHVIRGASQVTSGQEIEILFHDGKAKVRGV